MISDEQEALQAAYAAGRAIIGIWGDRNVDFSHCLYLVTDPEDADEKLLEGAVRRHLGLPWLIGETSRLLIREFSKHDPVETEADSLTGDSEEIFSSLLKRNAYIDHQYRFCECGIWAVLDKKTGEIVGKAGLTDGELSYHIYKPFRGRRYALECCEKILDYARTELELSEVFIKVRKENAPSIYLAEKLGFLLQCEEQELLIYRKRF